MSYSFQDRVFDVRCPKCNQILAFYEPSKTKIDRGYFYEANGKCFACDCKVSVQVTVVKERE